MISRRENILIRPWQQRKYENHRKKVESALPAIDTKPPATREHVSIKWKKQQREIERCKRIERENFLLLQKMNYTMKTSRVDNCWRTPPPRFLNKIPVYDILIPKIEDMAITDEENENNNNKTENISRKLKCYACGPKRSEQINIPEERIPWEPEKKSIRKRSKSVPVRLGPSLPTIKEKSTDNSPKSSASQVSIQRRVKTSIPKKISKEFCAKQPQSIIITRGSLKLAVSFPSDTSVKFQDGHRQKMLMKEFCSCKNAPFVANVF